MRKIELLAPAKNLDTGIAAVNCGADAVYIGPEKFGARSAAGNSVADIEKLLIHAHKYHARVYATVNTILYDHELEEARSLISALYNIGIDGVIFQDMGILEMDIPPVPLHASTQCDNYDIEKIKFFDRIGIPRVVLARELTIDQVKMIRGEVNCELEYFVHGALCVSMSGRCYMSAAAGGRSANRGECAQPCRKSYTVTDSGGRAIPAGKYPLSLKDLNRTEHIGELIDAGVDSFKIEGRLKDINYVKNIVVHYRLKIDSALEGRSDTFKASSGIIIPGFTPDPGKTFNRGYTAYFTNGRDGKVRSPHTPKSSGKRIGVVTAVEKNRFKAGTDKPLNNGDGLFFFTGEGETAGIKVNRADGGYVYPLSMEGVYAGAELFRNYDTAFEKILENAKTERRIPVKVEFRDTDSGYDITMTDTDGFKASESVLSEKQRVLNDAGTTEQIEKHLKKLGNTIFSADSIDVNLASDWFIPVSMINDMRRRCAGKLEAARIAGHKISESVVKRTDIKYPFDVIDYRWNVSNSLARRFYERHGVKSIKLSFETGERGGNENLMTVKMCFKYENGLCSKYGGEPGKFTEPYILDDGVNRFTVTFDCAECLMLIKKYK